MLKYPDNFNTPTFPAGPRIAVSRVMAIGAMIVFALILVVGGLIVWATRSQKIHPFLVAIDDFTGKWEIVGHDHGERTITKNRALQESVVAHFTQDWFTISLDTSANDAMWYGYSEKSQCASRDNDATAKIYCASGDELYNYFIYNVVPDYQERVAAGETLSLSLDNIYVSATNDVTDNGGMWRVIGELESNIYGTITVMAYVTLGRNTSLYPNTLGFYVMDFNAYNIGE